MRGEVDGLGFFDTPMGARPLTGVRDELGRQVYVDAGGNQFAVGQEAPNALADAPYNPRAPGRPQPQRSGTGASAAPPAWMQGVGNALVQGFTAPGRASRGEPVTHGDAWATALDYGVMGAPMAAPEGAVRMFAGRNAATANLDNMAEAQRLLASGADRGDVWRNTGWFQGVDGQMRFEIDDSGFGLRDDPIKPLERYGLFGRMDQTVQHNSLAAAYDLPYDFDLGTQGTRGGSAQFPTRWRTDMPERGISIGDVQDRGRIRSRGVDRAEVESTALHEMQHAIQNVEGFGMGSNVSNEAADIAARLDLQLAGEIEARMTPQEAADMARFRELKSQYDGAGAVPGDVVIEISDIKNRLRRVYDMGADLRAMRTRGMGGALEGGAVGRETAYDQYRRVSGEVEARNVETRRSFTPQQRIETPPWATQDVPDDMQIVRNALGPQ